MGDESSAESAAGAGGETQQPDAPSPMARFSDFVRNDRIGFASFLLRGVVIFGTIGALLGRPTMGLVMICFGLVSLLRLIQRVGVPSLSQEWRMRAMGEDSFHYVFYSVFTFMLGGSTMQILPPFLYSFLQVTAYIRQLTPLALPAYAAQINGLIGRVDAVRTELLMFIARSEMISLFSSVLSAIFGLLRFNLVAIQLAFFMTFFCALRYSSQRNPYPRMVWSTTSQTIDALRAHPSCPVFVANALQRLRDIVLTVATKIGVFGPAPGSAAPHQE